MPLASRRFAPFVPALAAASLVATTARAGNFGLPWPPSTGMSLTQDCNDPCCNDHVGLDEYAWDFANGTEFPIVAAREGTVVHVKVSSATGCGASSCVNDANYLVVDHGDGSQSVYLHLAHGSLDAAVRCGEFVRRGQRLATADSTGWSTGTHLHFQVNPLNPNLPTTCECGADGNGCAGDVAAWGDFWSSTAATKTMAIAFDEWPAASQCAARAVMSMPASKNADAQEATFVVDDADAAHFHFVQGSGTHQTDPSYHGGFESAPSSSGADARFSFAGVVTATGLYEIWSYVPLSNHATAQHVKHVATARGATASGIVNQNVVGAAFHTAEKIGALKFTGAAGEAVDIAADPADGTAETAFDAVLLHWVGPPGTKKSGEPCAVAGDCEGTLVCVAGTCAPGCDQAPCDCAHDCQSGTALCVPKANDAGCAPDAGAVDAAPMGDSGGGDDAAAGDQGGAQPLGDDGGCACRQAPGSRTAGGAASGIALAMAIAVGRRRGRKHLSAG